MASPVHQVQLVPGILEVPGDHLPAGLVLVRWEIAIPDRQRSANAGAIITARETIPNIGFLDRGRWQLSPSYPLEGSNAAPLALIQVPPGGNLIVESGGYQIGLLSFFLHPHASTVIQGNITPMGIQQAPYIPPTGNTSNIVSVNAISTGSAVVAANANRLGGLIENRSNRNLFVKFGDPTAAPVLTAGGDFALVPPNGNIDIIDGFTGPIGLIWASGFAAGGKAVITEVIP